MKSQKINFIEEEVLENQRNKKEKCLIAEFFKKEAKKQ
jgi:hypothetical protein